MSFALFERQGRLGVTQQLPGRKWMVERVLLYNRSGSLRQLQKKGVRKPSVFRAACPGFWKESERRKKIKKKKKGKGKVRFFQVIEKTKQIIAGPHSQEFLVRKSPLSQEELFISPMSFACFKANLPS